MRISLPLRVLLLVAAVNALVFGAGLFFLTPKLAQDEAALHREFAEHLASVIRPTPPPSEDLWVEQILLWPLWKRFQDAIILYGEWDVGPEGGIRPRGVFVNPLGALHRPPGFDMEGVLWNAARAIDSERTVVGPQGMSVPIYDLKGHVWGACWFQVRSGVDSWVVFLRILPWFVASTLAMTLGTFGVLRRFVLDPVAELAAGSQRVRAGDLSVRVPEPRHRDEMADLVRGFNEMTREVARFRSHLEEEVEQAREQARSAEAAAVRQRQLAAMGELAAGIAHEINNPLGGLLNAVEVLRREDLADERRARYLELLRNGLERIQGTVGKLLRFTPRGAERGPLSLLEAVRDAVALVQYRADEQGVPIEIEAGEDAFVVNGIRGELGQAVLNLLVNSLDALEGRPLGAGHVRVSLRRRGSEVLLRVADDGPGVTPEELERCADLFYTTKSVGKGTGLGLALVMDVARRHDGRVQLSSTPGAGFVVEIALPAWRGRST